jgi:protein SCO1/2
LLYLCSLAKNPPSVMKNKYPVLAAVTLAVFLYLFTTWFIQQDLGDRAVEGFLMSGKRLPNFHLTDVDGGHVSLDDFRGRVVLIFFGYTNCPDVCPLALKRFAELEMLLGEKSKDVSFIFITTDPYRDRPEKLSSFIEQFGGKSVIALTGSWKELAEVWKAYHVRPLDQEKPSTYVTHSAVIYLGDRELILRGILTPEMPAEEMLKEVIRYV